MRALSLEKMEQIEGGDWPGGALCFFAPAGWISSRGKLSAGMWDVIAKNCWYS